MREGAVQEMLPQGEGLRRAVRWLSAQPQQGLEMVEEACRRFNLSPLDEAFLLRKLMPSREEPGREK